MIADGLTFTVAGTSVTLTSLAIIAGEAAFVEVENNFGETNLYIPKEWKVQNELKRSFGAVEEIGRGEGSSVATLYLRGAANFGVIKIYYI